MAASGTIGGAVHAAQRGHFPLKGILEWADLAMPGREIERVTPADPGDAGRGLGLSLRRRVVLRARLKLSEDGLAVLQSRFDQSGLGTWQRQPRSARPVFVGPEGLRAEAVLAETGCLGMSVGAVRLSERAPNLIRTARSAKSADVFELLQAARQRAKERAGVDLEPALCFVDEQGRPVLP
jgi:UDP-N-acetylmuramate dehydrogenase